MIPTVGCSMLAAGTLYWMMWAKVLPMLLGYKIEPVKEVLADGSEIIKYVLSLRIHKRIEESWEAAEVR